MIRPGDIRVTYDKSAKRYLVNVQGRELEPYRLGTQSNPGTIFFDIETETFIKCGRDRAARELRVWRTVEGTDLEPYFAPIVAYGRNYVAFRAVWHDPSKYRTVARERQLARILSQVEVGDLHPGNWVVAANGNPVCIDYAAHWPHGYPTDESELS